MNMPSVTITMRIRGKKFRTTKIYIFGALYLKGDLQALDHAKTSTLTID
jgi:hypothetical protein